MNAVEKKTSKTQALSLRLDPKTKFILDFMARVKGQSITMIVERSIKEAADKTEVGLGSESRDWRFYWDTSEGVRTLKLISDRDLHTSYEEDEILEFAKAHWEFFYFDEGCKQIKRHFVDILWPRVNEYLEQWRQTKSQDYWATGKDMAYEIKAAGLGAPDWPRKTKNAASGKARSAPLDDDIPF